MKRKILIVFLGIFIFACLFATSVFATVNYEETATLADGTILPIYDGNHNPLIWYVSGTDASGNNVYSSVPNNRNEPNAANDTYVTYVSSTGEWAQLNDIYIHTYDIETGDYVSTIDDNLQIVVLNLREFDMIYLGGINANYIQYMYYPATLKDCPEKFKGKTALRLVDMSVCENLVGGFGGTQNFSGCTNLHTVRLPIGPNYTFEGKNNWKFKNTAISSIVIPEAVTSIGTDNFYGCKSLESIYILGNQTSLGQRNFEECTNLTNIYILGDNPTIDITSFKENFFECVNNGKTLDFKSTGKYFFFVTTNTEYLNDVMDAIGATAIVSYTEFVENPESYSDGRYIISGTNICDVYYGSHNIETNGANECVGICNQCGMAVVNHSKEAELNTNIFYVSYAEKGTKTVKCTNEGCTYLATEEMPALFECLGFSVPENGVFAITLGYRVDRNAINDYVRITGKDFDYGIFVVAKNKLGANDVVDADGNFASGVISTSMKARKFSYYDIKIVGIETDDHKSAEIAMGTYVIVKDENGAEITYIQESEPTEEGAKYSFVSYNDIIGKQPANAELVQ